MRRKAGTLIPIERSILAAAAQFGGEDFHGFRIAKKIEGHGEARRLTGHGTLYRALGRLEKQGHLSSRWEDPLIAAEEGRPRRKLYKLTAAGIAAVERLASGDDGEIQLKPGWATQV